MLSITATEFYVKHYWYMQRTCPIFFNPPLSTEEQGQFQIHLSQNYLYSSISEVRRKCPIATSSGKDKHILMCKNFIPSQFGGSEFYILNYVILMHFPQQHVSKSQGEGQSQTFHATITSLAKYLWFFFVL